MAGSSSWFTAWLQPLFARLRSPGRNSRARADPLRDYAWALGNIKLLGYELARLSASANLRPAPAAPPRVGLKSKLCTQSDIESAWFAFWCAELGFAPVYVRKVWETCFTAQALWEAGMLAPERSGLGFGCGRELLPSLFAKHGCVVLASDLPPTALQARKWHDSRQHARGPETLRDAAICPDPLKRERISFREIDMNHIPDDLHGGFDFCWSSCALEHLGSIENGSAFVENSLRVLKPGGIAVHTTEFNLDEAGGTLDRGDTVLFQRRHIAAIAARLAAAGHAVAELDFDSGSGLLDGFVDLPPFEAQILRTAPQPAHLKVSIWGYRCTSFGLIATRGG